MVFSTQFGFRPFSAVQFRQIRIVSYKTVIANIGNYIRHLFINSPNIIIKYRKVKSNRNRQTKHE